MPEWYPGCKVRFTLRLEDGRLEPPIPFQAETQLSGAEAFGSGAAEPTIPGQTEFVQVLLDVIPRACTVELNSHRLADKCRLTIDLNRLPVDPRLLRAMTVQVFGGVFDPVKWARANAQLTGTQGLLLPDLATAVTGEPGRTNELFRGFADDIEVALGSDGQTVTITARDLTGELLDLEVPPDQLRDLPGTLPIDVAIQLLITGDGLPPGQSRRPGVPGFTGIVVRNEVIDEADPTGELILPLPTLDEVALPSIQDSRSTVRRGRKRAPGNSQKFSYWDLINDLVRGAGYQVYLRTDVVGPASIGGQVVLPAAEIVITNPRTYYRDSTTAGDVTLPISSVRVFSQGAAGNAETITLKRNLKGTAVPTIRVTAFDQSTGARLAADYPPIPKNNRPSATGKGDKTEVKLFSLDQISGPTPEATIAALEQAARTIYEELGRGDFEVSIETSSLSALLENADEGIVGDLFYLRPKDPIIVELPRQDPTSGVVNSALFLANATLAERIKQAEEFGLPRQAAVALALAQQSTYLQNEFRTQQVTWDWSLEGWKCSIKAINYLDVRDSVRVTDARIGAPE